MKKFLMNIWPVFLWTALVVYIFAPVLGTFVMMPSPDSPPLPDYYHFVYTSNLLTGTMSWAPHDILFYLLPQCVYSDFTYQLDTVLIAIGFSYFLTALGIPTLSALFGGGVFAFMGYSFTLFSAGHRGFFFMTLYIVFLFAFLARALAGRGIAYYALAAICGAWALRVQPDFAVIYFGLAAVYTITHIVWQIVDKRRQPSSEINAAPSIKHTIIGICLASIVFLVTALPSIHNTLTSTLAHRKAQIESSQPVAADNQVNNGDKESETEDSKWIFATNWSLPPNEILEFIAPAVFGRQSGDPTIPYWGRLGQAWKWEVTHQGFINFRQHLVYLGSIPVALALFAVFWLFFAESKQNKKLRRETIFWLCVSFLALLLAFGRYTPFYKLFYTIPYMSYLRAPVKFIRIVEFGTAAMAAIGITQLLAIETQDRLRKRFAVTTAAIAAILIIGVLAVNAAPNAFLSRLNELGASRLIPTMATNTCNALTHAIVGFALVSAISFYAVNHKVSSQIAITILSLALAIDIAIVSRPFVVGQDREYEYTKDKNPIVNIISQTEAPRIMNFIQDQNLNRAFAQALHCKGYGVLPRNDIDNTQFFNQLPEIEAIVRMSELSGAHYILAPVAMAQHLPANRITPLSFFKPAPPPALFTKISRPVQNGYVLAKVIAPKPRAKLYTKWVSVKSDEILLNTAKIMARDNDTITIGKDIPCSGKGVPGNVEVIAIQNHNASKSVFKTTAETEQILGFTQGYNKVNTVLIDGVEVESFIGGYAGTAVLVPAGEHTVEIMSAKRNIPIAVSSALILALSLALFSTIAIRDLRNLFRS